MISFFKNNIESATLILRVGLGLVFLFGGISKLSQLLDPMLQAAMVSNYLSPAGYVNTFFAEFIFAKGVSPWFFLTGLSFFEVSVGTSLILGFLVRPLSFIFGLLMWTFVISLPVVTAPGVEVSVKTYLSPAMLVQIRDIALSGLLFVLYNLGSGPFSLDKKIFKLDSHKKLVSWDHLGLLVRISVALVLVVGGLFQGMDHIQSFHTHPLLLVVLGLVLLSGHGVRYTATAIAFVFIYYMMTKLNLDKSIIANFNGIKREFALLAASMVVILLGTGKLFTLADILGRTQKCLISARRV